MISETERLGTSTIEDLHVLCYEHHREMKLSGVSAKQRGEPAETLTYACQEPGCPVRYDSSVGYIVAGQETNTIEQEMLPRVHCPKDGHLMYLAEVRPERRNFRLWKCPACDTTRKNEETASA